MDKSVRAGLVLGCVLVAGCAGTPRMPADFDPRNATVVAATTAPELSLDGPQSKGAGAAKGAAKGGGLGFVIGGVACMGTGIFAPLCLATLVPAGLGIGAVSGAVVGAVTSDSAEDTGLKRQLLAAELSQWMVREPLADQVQQKSRIGRSGLTAAGATPAPAGSPGWQLKIALTELASLGNGPGVPYALQASASMEMVRPGELQPLLVKHYQATSASRMTTADWAANAAGPLRTALDDMKQVLVSQMVSDLAGSPARQ